MPTRKKFIIFSILAAAVITALGFWFFYSNRPSDNSFQNLSALPDVSVPTKFQAGGETIPLTWTDDNSGENLIIQSDQKYYDGNGNAEVYFSITNASGKNQETKIYFWFDSEDKKLAEIAKIAADGSNPSYLSHQSYSSNQSDQISRPVGKDIKGFTSGSQFEDSIASGGTNFYKAVIEYPVNSSGEFFIEAFGKAPAPSEVEGYGLLDPYFTSGLVGYWPFDGDDINWSTNTAYDRSVQGNNGTLTNMSQSTSPKQGKVGQALNFDGSDDYVTIPDGVISSGSFTATVWAKFNNVSGTNPIFGHGSDCTSNGWGLMTFLTNSNFTAWVVTTSPSDASYSTSPTAISYTPNTWGYFSVTFDNSARIAKTYFNGQLIGSASTGQNIRGTGNNFIGSAKPYTNCINYKFDGFLDEVRVYSRALSPDEIASHYRTGARKISLKATGKTKINSSLNNRWTNGLVGLWSFDGPDINWSTNTAYDRSGQGNTGTMTNMSTTTSPQPGKIGQALSFNGSSSYVNLGTSISGLPTSSTAYSVCAWMNANTTVSNPVIASYRVNSGLGLLFQLTIISSGPYVELDVRDDAGNNPYSTGSTILTGSWYHICGVRNGNSVLIYTNGVAGTSYSGSLGTITANRPRIGDLVSNDAEASFFNGLIDEVRIYNRALSPTEIADQYRAGARKFQIQSGQ